MIFDVAGAAAEVVPQRLLDLARSVGSGFASSSALAAMIMPGVQKPHWMAPDRTKASWMRCGFGGSAQPLDGDDVRPVELGHLAQAGPHGLAVHDHRAGAALALLVAGLLGAGQVQPVAQEVQQAQVGVGDDLVRDAVDGQLDLVH